MNLMSLAAAALSIVPASALACPPRSVGAESAMMAGGSGEPGGMHLVPASWPLAAEGSSAVDAIFHAIADNWFWTVGMIIAVTAILSGTIGSMVRTGARERTRREIAAYIAEGSMTPEQGERLIAAKFKDDDCGA